MRVSPTGERTMPVTLPAASTNAPPDDAKPEAAAVSRRPAVVGPVASARRLSVDATTPLLMAVINGQFDMALMLLDRGADPNLAAGGNGARPLWAAVNTQWQPRTRFPQPQQMEQQQAPLQPTSPLLVPPSDSQRGTSVPIRKR